MRWSLSLGSPPSQDWRRCRSPRRWPGIRPLISLILAFTCGVAVLLAVRTNFYRIPYGLGLESAEQFLSRMNFTYRVQGRYPHSMLVIREITRQSGLPAFSNRVRYEAPLLPYFVGYYGTLSASRDPGDGFTYAFVARIDDQGRIQVRPAPP